MSAQLDEDVSAFFEMPPQKLVAGQLPTEDERWQSFDAAMTRSVRWPALTQPWPRIRFQRGRGGKSALPVRPHQRVLERNCEGMVAKGGLLARGPLLVGAG